MLEQNQAIHFRPAFPEDEDFLLQVYSSTRKDIAALPLPVQQKDTLLRLQYRGQDDQYKEDFPTATHEIIQLGDQPIGRLYVNRTAEEILVVDIALLPQHRNDGVGGGVLQALQAEGARTGRRVRGNCQATNEPMIHLAERLGFRKTGDSGYYLQYDWYPDALA